MLQPVSESNITSCPDEFIDFSHQVADAVGVIHRKHFRRDARIEIKPDRSPVTQVDREAEQVVRDMVAARYPDHGVIGEEYPPHQEDAEYTWVVDPLDGTQLYIMGRPLFGLLLALSCRGQFILGLIDHAVLGERWIGADGQGTFFNDHAVRSRTCNLIAEASFVRPGHKGVLPGFDEVIDEIAGQSRFVQWGITPYDYGLLASGHVDMLISVNPKLHDVAPLDPIVRNAGGIATDWFGNSITLDFRGPLIMCGDTGLHPQVLERLYHYYRSYL
jgi:inositol-phosphate phosphatase/L-galactose 1-phosphate phosphatase/histidinol-phosphatase